MPFKYVTVTLSIHSIYTVNVKIRTRKIMNDLRGQAYTLTSSLSEYDGEKKEFSGMADWRMAVSKCIVGT